MSRIGRNPVTIPDDVKVSLSGQLVKVTGPKGSLEFNAHKDMILSENDGSIVVDRPTDQRGHRALHGTTRQMISNMVVGVSDGLLVLAMLQWFKAIAFNFSWDILMIFILICLKALR